MKKQAMIYALKHESDETKRLSIVRKLRGYLDEIDVIRALCQICVQTDSHKLRTSIIELLKAREAIANQYFAYIAIYAKRDDVRKWALVNLSLMECRHAKLAVTRGLRDASSSVQKAAAMNIGLYNDPDFVKEVENYFQRNHLDIMLYSICHPKEVALMNC